MPKLEKKYIGEYKDGEPELVMDLIALLFEELTHDPDLFPVSDPKVLNVSKNNNGTTVTVRAQILGGNGWIFNPLMTISNFDENTRQLTYGMKLKVEKAYPVEKAEIIDAVEGDDVYMRKIRAPWLTEVWNKYSQLRVMTNSSSTIFPSTRNVYFSGIFESYLMNENGLKYNLKKDQKITDPNFIPVLKAILEQDINRFLVPYIFSFKELSEKTDEFISSVTDMEEI